MRSSMSLAVISALVAAAVAMMVSRYSVSDICGWYLTDRGAPLPPLSVGDRASAAERPLAGRSPVEEDAEQGVEQDVKELAACQLSGTVPHCGCSYAAVESMNLNSMRSILSELVQTPFFRYFKTVRCAVFVGDVL
ncbi:MAG: hypothetical protein ABGY24_06590 [bacterium]|jgi:hypothetical protein